MPKPEIRSLTECNRPSPLTAGRGREFTASPPGQTRKRSSVRVRLPGGAVRMVGAFWQSGVGHTRNTHPRGVGVDRVSSRVELSIARKIG